MPYAQFFAAVDEHIQNYENGEITISEDIPFSTYYVVRQITHYVLSRYMGGQNDDLNRRKPFRNIGNAIVDLEWRAKNIDRKNIEAHAVDDDHVFALVVNKEVQQWMKTNNFGKTIDDYQRKKTEYGSVLLKKTETADKLIIEPVQWENISVDPHDIAGGMKVEHDEWTLLNLKKKSGVWDAKGITDLITKAQKSKQHTVKIYDVEGEFERCDIFTDTDNDTIGLYNVIYGEVGGMKCVLSRLSLKESRFKHFKRKAAEGRDFGMGVWEEVTEPQIWTNDAVIAEHEAMEIAGKVVIKTNKKGLPSAMDLVNGETIDLESDEFFEPVSLAPQTLPEFRNQVGDWFVNMQRDQSAYPGITGEEPDPSTPFQSLALQAAQSGGIFNKRRDQDGFDLLEVLVDWVIPFIVKQIDKDHTLTAAYSPRELRVLDEAIKEWQADQHVKGIILSPNFMDPKTPVPTPQYKEGVKAQLQQELDRKGNKRTLPIPKGYITLEKIQQKVRWDITDEMSDNQRRLNALATALGAMLPTDPARNAVIDEMLEAAGVSTVSLPAIGNTPAPAAGPAAGGGQGGQPAGGVIEGRINAVLPNGQQS